MEAEEKAAQLQEFEISAEEAEHLLDPQARQKLLLFKAKLLGRIFGNMQLNIRHLHIRCEDWLSNPLQDFSFGITLNHLSLNSVDDSMNSVKPDPTSENVRKRASFDSLSIYLQDERYPFFFFFRIKY